MAFSSRIWRVADGLALVAVIGWIGYATLGARVFGKAGWETKDDYHLMYDYSR